MAELVRAAATRGDRAWFVQLPPGGDVHCLAFVHPTTSTRGQSSVFGQDHVFAIFTVGNEDEGWDKLLPLDERFQTLNLDGDIDVRVDELSLGRA